MVERLEAWRISYEPEPPGERLVAAVVLLAEGDPARLDDAIGLAERDWRDLLVAAGLGDDDWPRVLDERFGS